VDRVRPERRERREPFDQSSIVAAAPSLPPVNGMSVMTASTPLPGDERRLHDAERLLISSTSAAIVVPAATVGAR
jgi:hypothetical protein